MNALLGRGVLIVTVNDYLAKRDAELIGKIHEFLGLSVGVVLNEMRGPERRKAYACDITYVTNSELGFDYLRDNMAVDRSQKVLRGLHYCIIDEVDSVLIDEARTPLIISGQSGKSTKIHAICNVLARQLDGYDTTGKDSEEDEEKQEEYDFFFDRKDKIVALTDRGIRNAERFFFVQNLSDPENAIIIHALNLALRANYLMQRDKDYVVKDGEVLIVDEFTGRTMQGRRYSDGLHQAIEAKERVEVKEESRTFATITYQGFFNKFEKKAGMTGTAVTEEKEFGNIYGLRVIAIPANRPVIRVDLPDCVYKTKAEKYQAVVEETKQAHENGQPVLIGTASIDVSEKLSALLTKEGIPHQVLNAKQDEKEAEIVAKAGICGAVTVATNMAGRGTDIKLDEKAKEAGGLFVIGTERHEARRIDDQLIGRSGRQGDPGRSKFYLSLEDDLLKLFGAENIMTKLGEMNVEKNEEIGTNIMPTVIKTAQEKIEGEHFAQREQLLKYGKVDNRQREEVYAQRDLLLEDFSVNDLLFGYIEAYLTDLAKEVKDKKKEEAYSYISKKIYALSGEAVFFDKLKNRPSKRVLHDLCFNLLREKAAIGLCIPDESAENYTMLMRNAQRSVRSVLLGTIDEAWCAQLSDLERLRDGVGLMAYGQKDPTDEYTRIAEELFDEMAKTVRESFLASVMRIARERMQEKEAVSVSA